MGVETWQPLFERCGRSLDDIAPGLYDQLGGALDVVLARWDSASFDHGAIHADLFPDNVLMLGDRVTGLIDFYFACTDLLAYDIAVCLNAWCFETDGAFNATKARLLLNGYRRVRPLSADELCALPLLARGAAMRFLLTRSYDWLNTPAGALVKRKDPLEYYRKLRFHQGVTGPGQYGIE
jgi:homoserine kinase type II